MSWSDMKDVIYDWFSAETGLTVIWANQSAPRPSLPYGLLNLLTGLDKLAYGELVPPSHDSPNTAIEILTPGRLTLSCQVLGDNAEDKMLEAQLSIDKPSLLNQFKRSEEAKIKVLTVTPSENYILVIDGVDFTYTSSSPSPTALEIRDGLVAVIVAAGVAYSDFFVTAENGVTDDELVLKIPLRLEFTLAVSAKLQITSFIAPVDMTVWGDGGVVDLTELLDTDWEGRAQMDVFFMVAPRTLDENSLIESVQITNLMNSEVLNIP